MLEAIKQAAREAGKIMLDSHLTEGQIEEKEGHANFVTAYDVAVQKFLAGRLPDILPEAGFLGEEGDGSQKVGEGYTFIVDPIDGTTNFIVGYQMSAVSIGLAKDGEAVLGVVYNPFREEMYWAEKGKGAFLNGRSLKIRDGGLKDGVVCFGTAPYNPEYWDRTFKVMREILPRTLDLRRQGECGTGHQLCGGRAERPLLRVQALPVGLRRRQVHPRGGGRRPLHDGGGEDRL